MKFRLPLELSGYAPVAYAHLKDCMEVEFSNEKRKLHHPVDIYNISSSEAWENLNDLFELLSDISENQLYLPGSSRNEWRKTLVRQLDHMLDALAQHVDSCRAIIKCCYSQDKTKEITKAVRRFNSVIEPFFDHVSHIVNAIKHGQRNLRVVYYHTPHASVPGFFAEGFIERGVAGPDPEIHYKGKVALSLHRELPLYVCGMFAASSALSQELTEATAIRPTNQFLPPDNTLKVILSVLRQVSLLPLMYFPDELKKSVPFVRYQECEKGEPLKAELQYPCKRQKLMPLPDNCQVSTSWKVLTVARTLQMPYFGKQ